MYKTMKNGSVILMVLVKLVVKTADMTNKRPIKTLPVPTKRNFLSFQNISPLDP